MSWINWLVIALYGAGLIAIGLYYSRRQDTTEEYFLAGRNQPPWLPGLSSVAAKVTVISYFSLPGEIVQNGPIFVFVPLASLPISYFIVTRFMIPVYMRLPITSVYELLEIRLGRPVRWTGSITFILIRMAWMSVMLYTASMVLANVMGWDRSWIPWIEIVTGLVTALYTLIGGIETVILTSALQFIVLLLGAFLTIVVVTTHVGGVSAWWPHHWMPHWKPQPFFSISPHVRVTAVGTVIGHTIFNVAIASADQVAVQRYLTTRNVDAARRSYLFNIAANGCSTILLGLVGLSVLGYYMRNSSGLPPGMNFAGRGDAFFPHFISHHLPVGISGLVISGILAAAMSGISSSMNSVATVISRDFLDTMPQHAGRSDAEKIRTARRMTFVLGAAVILASMVVRFVHGNLAELPVRTINLFTCPMFGLFFLAVFVPFATPLGTVMGAVYGLAGGITVSYWDVLTGQPGLSFQWIVPTSLICTLGFGCLLSLIPTRGRPLAVTLRYGAAALAPLLLGAAWAFYLNR